jgi:acyl-CoA synthetase (AMP-forming)/AMP-acid ligase II
MSPPWLATLAGYGGATALIEGDRVVTYAELVAEIGSAATRLSDAGIEAGDVIVLNADYSLSGVACFFALASLNTIVVPVVNMTPGAREILQDECGARFVCRPGAAGFLESWGEGKAHPLYDSLRSRGTAGLILLSSGSTGRPKAILHDLASLLYPRKEGRGNSRLTILLFLLFDHIGGINTLINVLFSGGTAVVATERTPNAICRLVEVHRVRVLPASPTFLNLILMGGFHELHDLSSLRLITYGTEPMPDQLLRRVRAAFPRARLLQTFGTSETGIAGTQSASSESTYFRIDDADYEYRIVDGELHLRTKTQFLGYLMMGGSGPATSSRRPGTAICGSAAGRRKSSMSAARRCCRSSWNPSSSRTRWSRTVSSTASRTRSPGKWCAPTSDRRAPSTRPSSGGRSTNSSSPG